MSEIQDQVEKLKKLEKIRSSFLKNFQKIIDEPELKNIQFNFCKYGEEISNYITASDLPMPLTIGVNGEWGSGKTTLIKTVQKNIDKITENTDVNVKTKYIDFNAWESEKTDIVLSLYHKIEEHIDIKINNEQQIPHVGLIKKIKNKFSKQKLEISATVLAMDMILRRFGNITYDEAKRHFEKQITQENISNQVIKSEYGRLVVFIDDLDRCDAKNILTVLERIKNILTIKNLIFVITVDMKKIERAWELQYNSAGGTEGKEHIEKLFPIVLTLPLKTDEEVENYIKHLTGLDTIYQRLHNQLVRSISNNPRQIKRLLNMVFFIIKNYDLNNIKVERLDELWQKSEIHFAFIITWISLTTNNKEISKIIQKSPSIIIPLTLLFDKLNSLSELKKYSGYILGNEKEEFRAKSKLERGDIASIVLANNDIRIHGEISHRFIGRLFTTDIKKIIEIIVEKDNSAFKTIKQIGRFFTVYIPTDYPNLVEYDEKIYEQHDEYYQIFKKITEKGGLIGV